MTRIVTASMVAKLLGANKPNGVEDDHVHGYHYSLVQKFVTYMATRDAGFDLYRFVGEAGYARDVAHDMAKVAWSTLDTRQRKRLRDSVPYACRARNAWWWDIHRESRDAQEEK